MWTVIVLTPNIEQLVIFQVEFSARQRSLYLGNWLEMHIPMPYPGPAPSEPAEDTQECSIPHRFRSF